MKFNLISTLFSMCLLLLLTSCKDKTGDAITEPDPREPDPVIFEPCSSVVLNYPAAISSDPDPVIENNDLTIGWVSRLPRLDYIWGSPNPGVDG